MIKLNLHDAEHRLSHVTSSFAFSPGQIASAHHVLSNPENHFCKDVGFSTEIISWKWNAALGMSSYPTRVDFAATLLSASTEPSYYKRPKMQDNGNKEGLGFCISSPECNHLIIKNSLLDYMISEHDLNIAPYLYGKGTFWKKHFGAPQKVNNPKKKERLRSVLRNSSSGSYRLVRTKNITNDELHFLLKMAIEENQGRIFPYSLGAFASGEYLWFREDRGSVSPRSSLERINHCIWFSHSEQLQIACVTNAIPTKKDIEVLKQYDQPCISPIPFYQHMSGQ